MTQLSIRQAIASDAADIAHVQVMSWRVAYEQIVPSAHFAVHTVEHRTTRWQHILSTPDGDGQTFVLIAQDQICGFVSIATAEPSCGELLALYVHPESWGCGYGHALHEHASARFVERGDTTAILWVFSQNDRARAFYTAHGWLDMGVEMLKQFGGEDISMTTLRLDVQSTL